MMAMSTKWALQGGLCWVSFSFLPFAAVSFLDLFLDDVEFWFSPAFPPSGALCSRGFAPLPSPYAFQSTSAAGFPLSQLFIAGIHITPLSSLLHTLPTPPTPHGRPTAMATTTTKHTSVMTHAGRSKSPAAAPAEGKGSSLPPPRVRVVVPARALLWWEEEAAAASRARRSCSAMSSASSALGRRVRTLSCVCVWGDVWLLMR